MSISYELRIRNFEGVRRLVAAGAEATRDHLILAITSGQEPAALFLAAKVNDPGALGQALLVLANVGGPLSVARVLLERGAAFRGPALVQAAGRGQTQLAALIHQKGVSLCYLDKALSAARRDGARDQLAQFRHDAQR